MPEADHRRTQPPFAFRLVPALRPALIAFSYLSIFIALDKVSAFLGTLPGGEAWYPPAGLHWPLLLSFGLAYMPVVWAAELISAVWVWSLPLPFWLSALVTLSVTLGYGLGAAWLKHDQKIDLRLRRLQDVIGFLLVALATTLGIALISAGELAAGGAIPLAEYPNTVLNWWVGDAIGVVIVTTFLLVHGPVWANGQRQWKTRVMAAVKEAAPQALPVLFTLWVIFGLRLTRDFHAFYLCFLPVIWAALRRGLPGVTTCILLINAGAVAAVRFFNYGLINPVDIQLFMLVISVTGLLLGAVVTERKETEVALTQQAAETAALYRASARLLNSGGDLPGLALQIARAVTEEFASAHCAVLMPVHESETRLKAFAQAGELPTPDDMALPLSGPGLTVTAFNSGEAVYVPDVGAAPNYVCGNALTRSELAVPLEVDGRAIGVLDLQSPERDAFDERARRIVSAFAEHASLALENARLLEDVQVARRFAEEANRLKSQFFANASHELRTPLTSIIGSLSMIADDRCDTLEEAGNFSRIAYASANTLLDTINKLLDSAKLEAGKMEIDVQDVTLAPVLTHVHALTRFQAEEKKIRFDLHVPANPAIVVRADMSGLQRILLNLVNNAIKFTDEGSILVKVEPGREEGVARIVVQDTGIGIAPAVQAQLFRPFVQADGSLTRKYGGAGLGLSISQQLAQLMGGTLTLHSAGEGQGSTFTLCLPLSRQP
jgi:signal transduction histidine kinase/integral membrane sensor domain MASE1